MKFKYIFIAFAFALIALVSCKKTYTTTADLNCTDCNLTATLDINKFSSKATFGWDSGYFLLKAVDYSNPRNILKIRLYLDTVEANKPYTFFNYKAPYIQTNKYATASFNYEITRIQNFFYSDSIANIHNKFVITKLDIANKKISGTFRISLRNDVSRAFFTDGKFTDIPFEPWDY